MSEAAADTTSPEATPATPAPVARIVTERERHKTISLEWPVEFDGKLFEAVTVRRLTAKEVAAFVDKMSSDPDQRFRWPMTDAPEAVLDAMDDDDITAVNKAITDFLPRRFRADPEAASTPPTGADTAPKS